MPSPATRMTLVSCVELDPWNVTMKVRECWTEKRWGGLRVVQHEQVKSYDLAIRVERWLDADSKSYVLRQDPRHMRLFELWAAWRQERRLDIFVGIDPPAT